MEAASTAGALAAQAYDTVSGLLSFLQLDQVYG
jgi:hypothetical protein